MKPALIADCVVASARIRAELAISAARNGEREPIENALLVAVAVEELSAGDPVLRSHVAAVRRAARAGGRRTA